MSARITVSHLGKAYKQYPSKWARLVEWILPLSGSRHHLHWVLQDLSFVVQSGEALGVVGVNGAGKSTLLKMLAGTSMPTAGVIKMHGRIASLLELGIGFHPDFTGRENVYLTGQLQQLSEAEITRLMPSIEEFAGVGHYIDEPLRIYSSGMQVRLAFSIATVIRPDILIVDEALSVGDAYFQHKSFQRIRQLREQGTTILLVSHDKAAIQAICDSAILLNEGKIAMEGDPETVMNHYNALLAQHDDQTVQHVQIEQLQAMQVISGNGQVHIGAVRLCDHEGKNADSFEVGQLVSLQLELEGMELVPNLVVGYSIKDRLGQDIFGTNTAHLNYALPSLKPNSSITIAFDFSLDIGPGTYSVTVAAHGEESHIGNNYQWKDLALVFTVTNRDHNPFVGVAFIPPTVRVLS